MPWFTVGLDAVFHVPREVFVNTCTGSAGFERSDHVRDRPPSHLGRFEHRHRAIALFDDDFHALPHLLQHGMHVAREFGLRHVHGHGVFDHTSDTGVPLGIRQIRSCRPTSVGEAFSGSYPVGRPLARDDAILSATQVAAARALTETA